MLANIDSRAEQLVDARGGPRFTGEQAETTPGVASGHVPGARNVPYPSLFNADGTWKDKAALKAALSNQPEIRPEVVARARLLAADPAYPSPAILRQVGKVILNSPDPDEQAD